MTDVNSGSLKGVWDVGGCCRCAGARATPPWSYWRHTKVNSKKPTLAKCNHDGAPMLLRKSVLADIKPYYDALQVSPSQERRSDSLAQPCPDHIHSTP